MEGPTIMAIEKKAYVNKFSLQHGDADIRQAGQNISRVLWHKVVHNHVHNRPPMDSSQNHSNTVHTLTL